MIRILPIVDWGFPIDKQSKRGKGLERKEPGKDTESNRLSLFPSGPDQSFQTLRSRRSLTGQTRSTSIQLMLRRYGAISVE
jgi:hypothetical protein